MSEDEHMLVECLIEDDRWSPVGLGQLARQAGAAVLIRLGLDPDAHEISLIGCDNTRIAALNADFRGKPQPTNVLSWPSAERAATRAGAMPTPPAEAELGDIAIAYETCEAEAQAAQKPMSAHVSHLLVHATLHLLGFDHVRDADAALMERLETEILGKLGLDDPYRDES
jgi:probable rRNA maturation factor